MYVIQHCFICRPSDSTVSEEAGIEPCRTVAALAMTARRSDHSARSHPQWASLGLIHLNARGRSFSCLYCTVSTVYTHGYTRTSGGGGKGVTKRCRLSWLTNSALVYEPKCGGGGGVTGSQPMTTAMHITWHGAQINFGDNTQYFTYAIHKIPFRD